MKGWVQGDERVDDGMYDNFHQFTSIVIRLDTVQKQMIFDI